jgi:DNA-binding response OmpR family regulator
MTVELLEAYLRRERFAVHTADNGYDALELVHTEHPDLIVLDLMLPRVEGLDVCRILRAESDVPIIILTARTTEEDLLLGLDLGADDYIKKPFSPREVVARVRTVLRRGRTTSIEQTALQFGPLHIDRARHEVTLEGQPVELTPSEFHMLNLLASTPDHVFSRADLLERTPGLDHHSLKRAVDFHIMNLRRKIEPDDDSPKYIQTVYGVGYKFTGNSDPA